MITDRRAAEFTADVQRATRQLREALLQLRDLQDESTAGDYASSLPDVAGGPTTEQIIAVLNTSAPAIRVFIEAGFHWTNIVALY